MNEPAPLDALLTGLRAAAEPTRLRILGLCAQGELTVSELTQILAQSQPRVSRHLKLLCEAGLLDRHREGNSVFHRVAAGGPGAALAAALTRLIPDSDAMRMLDLARLAEVRERRATMAAAYFRRNAASWDAIRSLHADDAEVERALLELVPPRAYREHLDIGTGTGRMIELLGPRVERSVGLDLSHEMLAVARAKLQHSGPGHWSLRQGDMYRLPFAPASMDLVTVHQVLHYADRPGAVVAEAARVLRPGGRLAIADFASHELEALREEHAHRRLGFDDDEVTGWCIAAGLQPTALCHLPGRPLTVTLWVADREPAAATSSPSLGTVPSEAV